MTEPRRCLRGPACRDPETVNGTTVGALADRPLCAACEARTATALAVAPALYFRLRARARTRGGMAQGERVASSRPGSFGLNLGPLHATEELHWHLTAWADEVAATAGLPAVDRTSQPEGSQVDDAARFLRRYLSAWVAHAPVEFQLTRGNADPDDPKAQPSGETVCAVQAGWEACGWLIDWRSRAERMLHIPVLVHYPPEPCPSCDTERALRREDGSGKVECTVCGKAWTLEMYETFVHAWVGGGQPAPPSAGPGREVLEARVRAVTARVNGDA